MEEMKWFNLPNYMDMSLETWLIYALCGVVGLIIRLRAYGESFEWPCKTNDGFNLKGIGDIITAVAVATLADHNVLAAIAAGAGSKHIVSFFFQSIPQVWKRLTGLSVEEKR